MFFEEQFDRVRELTMAIFDHPELGYQEFETRDRIKDYLLSLDPGLEIQDFSTTGMRVDLNSGADQTLAFVAELDALIQPSHFQADSQTGAAHACGHFTQMGIAVALFSYLLADDHYRDYDFNFAFVFVPAEEYIDLDYRQGLIDQGKVSYFGGKPEAMRLGVFDDVDLVICTHSIGEEPNKTVEINCDLAGFLYKYYTFKGKASHAGWDPFSGVNAYSMSTLFNTGLGLMRQQIREDLYVRMNPILMGGSMSTNVIPEEVRIGTDLRTVSVDYMKEVADRMDRVAQGAALALGGQVEVTTQMGYLPFVQDRYLSTFVQEAFDNQSTVKEIINDRGAVAAAGDVGDLSFMRPTIQISYGGFDGTIHGADFRMVDDYFVLVEFPAFLVQVLDLMKGNLDPDKLYKRSYEDYAAYLATLN
ncbi:amidohydrolase [Hutsoniella sourekii]